MSEPPYKKFKQASLLSFMQRRRSPRKHQDNSGSAECETAAGTSTVNENSCCSTKNKVSNSSFSRVTVPNTADGNSDSGSQDSDVICLDSPHKSSEPLIKNHTTNNTSTTKLTANTATNPSSTSQSIEEKMADIDAESGSQVIEYSQSSDFVTCADKPAAEFNRQSTKHPKIDAPVGGLTASPSKPGTSRVDTTEKVTDSQGTDLSDTSRDLFDSDSDSILIAAAMEASLSQQINDSPTQTYSDSQLTDEGNFDDALGTPLCDMRLFPEQDAPSRTEKKTSDKHRLFIKTPTVAGSVPEPCTKAYCDVWDDNHVRMPCSSKNLYPEQGTGKLLNRWSLIETSLLSPMTSSYDIEEAILAYNSRYKGKWDFTLLHQTINEVMTSSERKLFFDQTLPGIMRLALSLPNLVTVGVPLLRTGLNYSLTFSQQQIASLLANAFFCTYPRRNASHKNSEYSNFPSINMNGMFAPSGRNKSRDMSMIHKLKCLFHYFNKVTEKVPTGCVTYKRRVLDGPTINQWSQSDNQLTDCLFTSQGFIEDAEGAVQADFANCRIGGGVLRTGCVQEEIQFTIHPELLITRLFTETLASNEVMIIKGAERFSNYSGYADTFRYTGPHNDTIVSDSLGRRYRHIVAMDATRYGNTLTQYPKDKVLREMNKAYCAFYSKRADNVVAMATGNWGCGAFHGNHRLKALIQMMVAAQCKRQVYYSVYGDSALKHDLHAFHSFCLSKKITVGKLWKEIVEYDKIVISQTKKPAHLNIDILQFIQKRLK